MGGTSGKEHACQCRRHKKRRFDTWVGKIPWRTWQPTPVLLPRESNEQRSLADYSSVQFSRSVVSDSLQPHGLQNTRLPSPSPNSRSLLKLRSIELLMPSNHLILCHPLLLLPSIFSSIKVFSKEPVVCIRWPKYWSFSISPSN